MNYELWTVKYTATFRSAVTEEKEQETGILVACSLANAVSLIEEYYGEDLISINHLAWIGDGQILLLDKDGKPIE